MNPSWKGAKVGRIAAALLESRTASPIILLDEFDKPVRINSYENPHDIFHTLLEEENAQSFLDDDYLEFPLHAEKITWIASANDISDLAPSIVDRFLVINVPDPSPKDFAALIDNIYAIANARHVDVFESALRPEVRTQLTRFNPWRISRLLDLAFAHAAAEGRRDLVTSNIALAEEASPADLKFRGSIGFIAR